MLANPSIRDFAGAEFGTGYVLFEPGVQTFVDGQGMPAPRARRGRDHASLVVPRFSHKSVVIAVIFRRRVLPHPADVSCSPVLYNGDKLVGKKDFRVLEEK